VAEHVLAVATVGGRLLVLLQQRHGAAAEIERPSSGPRRDLAQRRARFEQRSGRFNSEPLTQEVELAIVLVSQLVAP